MGRLTQLKLSYNAFIGTIPTEIANLKRLELLHLHSNRIEGNIVLTDLQQGYGESSFITDCGSPAIYDPVDCTGCTMCCNKDGDCQPDVQPPLLQVQALGFDSYKSFCGVLFGIIVGLCFILALVSYVADLNKDRLQQALLTRRRSSRFLTRSSSEYLTEMANADETYAMKHFGEGSVYSFFLGDSVCGWLVALLTVAVQVLMLTPYIEMAEFNLSEETDVKYTWKCNRSENACEDTDDVTLRGWVIFVILMVVFLAKDLICGLKMVNLSGKRRHGHSLRARFFSGGVILCCTTMYIIYASAIYINATATTNTELATDAVIIIFITEIDEKIFELIEAHAPSWLNEMRGKIGDKEGKEEQEEDEGENEEEEEVKKNSLSKEENKEEEKREEQEDEEEEGVDWQKRFLEQQELNSEFKKNMKTLSNTVVRMELEMKIFKLAK